jgi:hypothetical protein
MRANLAKVAQQAQEAAKDRQLLIHQYNAIASADHWTYRHHAVLQALRSSILACERTIIQLASLIVFPLHQGH